MILAQNKNQ